MKFSALGGIAVVCAGAVRANYTNPAVLDACPGYNATEVSVYGNSLNASLVLAGKPCNVYGTDVAMLQLEVTYESGLFQGPSLFI